LPRISVAALMEGLNSGAVSAPFEAALDAEVIIVIGANPTVNHPLLRRSSRMPSSKTARNSS